MCIRDSKHTIHQIPALISMAVAGERRKVLRPQPLLSERSQNTLQALFHSRCSLCSLRRLLLDHRLDQVPCNRAGHQVLPR